MIKDLIDNIPILAVLEKLGITYKKTGNNIYLYEENGVITRGWKACETKNFIIDFTAKGRASGPPYAFTMHYLHLSAKDTFQWFEENFGIKNNALYDMKYKNKSTKKVPELWIPYSRNRLKSFR